MMHFVMLFNIAKQIVIGYLILALIYGLVIEPESVGAAVGSIVHGFFKAASGAM